MDCPRGNLGLGMSYLLSMRARTARPVAATTSDSAGLRTWIDASGFENHHLIGAWTVSAMGCMIAMFVWPEQATIPYHLGWAFFALAFGLGTWSTPQLVTALTWYTITTGIAFERRWMSGEIGWDETTEVPLMLLLALMMVWHVRRRQTALAVVTKLAELDGLTGLAQPGDVQRRTRGGPGRWIIAQHHGPLRRPRRLQGRE